MQEKYCGTSPLTRIIAAGIGVLMGIGNVGGHAGTAPESAYSTFDWEKDCKVLDSAPADVPASWVRLKCPGYKSYPIFVVQDDQRMSVGYGDVDPKSMRWESFQGFNRVNETVEWRLKSTRGEMQPFVTIHRWFVSHDVGELPVLVVSSVAGPESGQSCPVGYVDAAANEEANKLAREVADTVALDFICGEDEARFHGKTEPETPQPVIAPSK